jgi:hypothetical protein
MLPPPLGALSLEAAGKLGVDFVFGIFFIFKV